MLLDLPAVRAADTLAAAGRAEDLRAQPDGLVEAADPQVARLDEAGPAADGGAAPGAPLLAIMRSPWPDSFPDVIAHGVQGIRRYPDWAAAKTGDADAAMRLVERLARPEAAARLREALSGQDAVLVAVRQAERGGGDNLIPAAFARWLSAETGLPVHDGLYRLNRTMRTDAGAIDRLLRRARWAGEVEACRAYVIVDDVVTQGGTVADLRGHIEAQGGRVVAITALQAPGANATSRLDPADLARLRARLGPEAESWWTETFGHDWTGLTASEARQLLRIGDGAGLRAALGPGLDALRRGPDDA